MPIWIDRLDPRRSLGAAVGWAVSLITVIAATAASLWVASIAESRIQGEVGMIFRQYATQISNELDINLYTKLQWIAATANVVAGDRLDDATHHERSFVNDFHRALSELNWIGVAGADGRIAAGSGKFMAVGTDASAQRWYAEGRKAPWLGDTHTGNGDNGAAPSDAGAVIEMGAPIFDEGKNLRGVIGARLSLSWIRSLQTSLTESLRSNRSVETLLVARDGLVLLGPKSLVGRHIVGPPQKIASNALDVVDRAMADKKIPPPDATSGQLLSIWPDGQEYIAGYAVSDGVGGFPGGIGWTVWVRESTESAFAPARRERLRIFGAMALFGMLTAAVGILVARRLTRRLTNIASSADAIREGQRHALDVPSGEDEAGRIGQSLQKLLDELEKRSAALEKLNAELDVRVAARTREVERMADENRHAALVRERLRLAREMHDTLAHSMMALLTEIRVMRKLARSTPAALDEELARAEEAAREGLEQARAAIGQLRQDAVRDIGLGPRLRELLARTQEKLGIAVQLEADPACERMADRRAEILCRVAEEALRNIERHAHAGNIWVSLLYSIGNAPGKSDSLILSVADDGVGFDAGAELPGSHFGLRGMQERADLIGATLSIDSRPGNGTRIKVTAPL